MFRKTVVAVALATACTVSAATIPAYGVESPSNAITAEANGVSVFIGYSSPGQVKLEWAPEKRRESTRMLYQVQRSDGAMIASRTSASTITDRNLEPNTSYSYTLTTYEATSISREIKKGKRKGARVNKTVTKRLGSQTITVTTPPDQVIALRGKDASLNGITLTWAPTRNADRNPVTYNIYADNALQAVGVTGTEYRLDIPLTANRNTRIEVVAEGLGGESKSKSGLNVLVR